MLRAPSTLSSSDLADWPPVDLVLDRFEDELAQVEAHANGQLHPRPQQRAGVGQNDPLAGLSQWRIFKDCIWISDEDTYTKIMLLCIARFMDKNLRGSSMSYSQIATACGFGERKAKSAAKAARDRWLRIEVRKGRYWPGKGNENLYHGIIPQKWLAELRRRKTNGHAVSIDEGVAAAAESIVAGMAGVSTKHPEGDRGVCGAQPGCLTDTLTPHTPQKKESPPPRKVAGPTSASAWQLTERPSP